jgi:imidazolonepropionase
MIEMGLAVAIATDCNPGSSCIESMPFCFGISVVQMGMSVPEALTASTLNAAYALGIGAAAGSITPGKSADFLLLEGETPGILAFRTGAPVVTDVYKAGKRVWRSAAEEAAPREVP